MKTTCVCINHSRVGVNYLQIIYTNWYGHLCMTEQHVCFIYSNSKLHFYKRETKECQG